MRYFVAAAPGLTFGRGSRPSVYRQQAVGLLGFFVELSDDFFYRQFSPNGPLRSKLRLTAHQSGTGTKTYVEYVRQ